jgi:hypothetical protein
MAKFLLMAFLLTQYDGTLMTLLQSSPSANQDKKEEKADRRVQLSPFGSLLLPTSYKAYRLTGYIDAWYGYFVSADCSLRVDYSAGLVQTPFETDQDKIVWIKTEPTQMGLLKYGLKRTKDTEQIIASIGGMNFYTTNKKETDLKTMLDLLRTVERGPCPKCERAWPETPSNTHCTGTRGSRQD